MKFTTNIDSKKGRWSEEADRHITESLEILGRFIARRYMREQRGLDTATGYLSPATTTSPGLR